MTLERMNDELKKEIWKILDSLRGYISRDEYHIVLFLSSLQRRKILEDLKNVEPANLKYRLDELLEGTLVDYNEMFEELYNRVYKPIIVNIPLKVLSRLTDGIFVIDEITQNSPFANVFEEILSYFLDMAGKAGTFFSTPNAISEFANSLADITHHSSIYNPFAGLGSFGVLVKESQSYYGQEVNTAAWAIGLLRLFAHQSPAKIRFQNEDSLHHWYPVFEQEPGILEKMISIGAERKRVDLIISSPPFGYKLNDAENVFGQRYYAETLVLDQGLDILSEHGKIVCLVSNGALFRGGTDQRVRKRLIDNDFLEMVISFPGSLLPNTSIPFSIVVVNKKKRHRGYVKFVDAKSFIRREKKSWDFAHRDLLASIHSGKESDFLKLVRNAQIVQADYNFNVNRYFVEANPDGVTVGELGEIFATNAAVENVGHFISRDWLKTDPLNYIIPNNFVSYAQLPDRSRQISESCFLISTTGGALRIGYFKYEGIPYFIPQDIFPFRLNAPFINPDYFVYQLLSENTQKQVRAYAIGSVIPRLSKADFLLLKVDVPSLVDVHASLLHQESILRGARNAYMHVRENEIDLERKFLDFKDNATRDFQSMKHTFRQYLSSLKSNTLGTKKFLEINAGKPISLDMLYSKNLGQDLGTHLKNVDALIESLSNLLEDTPEKGFAEVVNVVEFVTQFQKEFTFDKKFAYLFFIDDLSFKDEESAEVSPNISINRAQFKKVLSNIVSNAIEHGFVGKAEYNIFFSIRAEGKSLILEIKNNGKPLAKGLGLKELTTRGEKTVDSKGTGLGGYDIKTIIEMYDGKLELENNPEDEFPVVYRLKFPLINE